MRRPAGSDPAAPAANCRRCSRPSADTHVGKTQILAAADRQGFQPISANEVKSLAGFFREPGTARQDVTACACWSPPGVAPFQRRQPNLVCIVGISPLEAAQRDRSGHWAGVEPVSHTLTGGDMFMFFEGPEGRRSVASTDVSEVRRHVRDGDMQMLLVGDQDGSTLAIYGVMRPEI